MTASSVWWRSGRPGCRRAAARTGSPAAARSPRPTSPAPWPRRARSASGSPSSRSTRAATRASSRRTPGRAARGPLAEQLDGVVVAELRQRRRPARRRCRAGPGVVVSTRSRGARATRTATRSATASTRCSQLSRISSEGTPTTRSRIRAWRSARWACSCRIRPAAAELPHPQHRADLDRHPVGRGDRRRARRSARRAAPRGCRARARAGSCRARRRPRSMVTRADRIIAASAATSSSRPISREGS